MKPLSHLLAALTLVFSAQLAAQDENETTAEEAPGGGPKVIYVVTDEQKLYAWEGNQLVYEFDVVTGRPGKETEAGVFEINRKYEDYTSNSYGAEMPFSMFFTLDGKAIHGTQWATTRSFIHAYINESVGSHGCVGLTVENAALMFEWAPMGTRIVVVEEEQDEEGAPRDI